MWAKEQPNQQRAQGQPRAMNAPQFNAQQQPPFGYGGGSAADHFARGRAHGNGLPPPAELAARVEEAKTSAKLLQQLVQSTPPQELQTNDLVKEFGQRVAAAQKSVQGYVSCDNPPPDEDTLQTLIETSEQLSLAASKHQRAVLQARRQVGPATPPVVPPRGEVPILQLPALPIRTDRSQTQPAPQPGQRPYPPPDDDDDDAEDNLYNPAPKHPLSMQANLYRSSPRQPPPSLPGAGSGLSSTHQFHPVALVHEPVELSSQRTPPAQGREDPFSDDHADLRDPADGPMEPESGGGPLSRHPGWQSTQGYLHRQQSSGDKLVMSGARTDEKVQGVRTSSDDSHDSEGASSTAGVVSRRTSARKVANGRHGH